MPRRLPPALAALAAALLAGPAPAQGIHQDDFSGRAPAWQRGLANVPFQEEAHVLTDKFIHSFPTAEYVRIKADVAGQLNPNIPYGYPTSPAPVTDELRASVWVRTNRPGVQLLARVVLPKERNPENLTEPLTTVIRGGSSDRGGGHWQPLELRRPVQLLKDEQQMLRAKLQRDVNIADAYIDRLILNLYGGPGVTEVWIDDLQIGPVLDLKPQGGTPATTTALSKPTGATGAVTAAPPGGTPGAVGPLRAVPGSERRQAGVPVEFNRGQLRVGGRQFFFRGIRHSDTPLDILSRAGLNTLFLGEKVDPAFAEEAAKAGFWLTPTLVADAADPDAAARALGRQPADDAVLFWHLGNDRTTAQIDPVIRAAQAVRGADPRPVGADVWDGLWSYSVNLDMVSAHRFPLMTSLDLSAYRDWLVQRRQLHRGTFFWTWVQTHLPDWYLQAVLPDSGKDGFDQPIGPQAEQIRLLTYIALASGCKGLGFWSDRFLADSHQGRDRLLTLALLNQEIQMLEPLLFGAVAAPAWIEHPAVSIAEVKAAVIRCDRGVLVLPMWLGRGAQHVPGQSAANRLTLTVPQVPTGNQAWLVSPGEVKSLPAQRIAGGMQVTIPEFDQTAALVFTADNSPTGLLVRWQEQSRRMAKLSAQFSYQLAVVQIDKVRKVQAQLDQLAGPLPGAANLLPAAEEAVKEAADAWNAGDHRKAYRDSQRALRPLRVLMRAEWERAAKSLGPQAPPTASPYATGYFTLPRHWQFRQELSVCTPAGNQLPDGDFERSAGAPPGWQAQRIAADDIIAELRVSDEEPHEGRHCLAIRLRPKPSPNNAPAPEALEPTFVGVTSPPVKLTPGSLVRVSGWMKLPQAVKASPDGALLYDSAGGEPLGVRLTEATPQWRHFVLYRRVPANGLVQVTAALTGFGTVYFDDLKVEPLNSR